MNQVALHVDMDQAAMASMMGFSEAAAAPADGPMFPRLKVMTEDIQGLTEIKGKTKKTVIVSAGAFALDVNGTVIYADSIEFRCFFQRFLIKRYDNGLVTGRKDDAGKPRAGGYIHTTMTGKQWVDERIDDTGGINCGKPAGFIEDFKSLQKDLQDLIKNCRTYRVMFGQVTMIDPVDAEGNDVTDLGPTPCIYEIGPAASKAIAPAFQTFTDAKALPWSGVMSITNVPNVNGTVTYYTPEVGVKITGTVPSDADIALGVEFNAFITTWNDRIKSKHHDLLTQKGKATPPADDMDILEELGADQFIDVSSDLD